MDRSGIEDEPSESLQIGGSPRPTAEIRMNMDENDEGPFGEDKGSENEADTVDKLDDNEIAGTKLENEDKMGITSVNVQTVGKT